MLSQRSKYAIRAVLYLATNSSPAELKSGKDVAEGLKIPLAFTGKILQELARNKVISSVKGPKGGFYISSDNLSVPMMKILESTNDLEFFTSCGLGLSQCSEEHPCPIHNTFKKNREDLFSLFKTKTIRELSEEVLTNAVYIMR